LPLPCVSPSRMSFSCLLCHRPSSVEIYTLSLHDALPICLHGRSSGDVRRGESPVHLACRLDDPVDKLLLLLAGCRRAARHLGQGDRKSTRLNSSHVKSSYAVFCLKKKTTSLVLLPLAPLL